MTDDPFGALGTMWQGISPKSIPKAQAMLDDGSTPEQVAAVYQCPVAWVTENLNVGEPPPEPPPETPDPPPEEPDPPPEEPAAKGKAKK